MKYKNTDGLKVYTYDAPLKLYSGKFKSGNIFNTLCLRGN